MIWQAFHIPETEEDLGRESLRNIGVQTNAVHRRPRRPASTSVLGTGRCPSELTGKAVLSI